MRGDMVNIFTQADEGGERVREVRLVLPEECGVEHFTPDGAAVGGVVDLVRVAGDRRGGKHARRVGEVVE